MLTQNQLSAFMKHTDRSTLPAIPYSSSHTHTHSFSKKRRKLKPNDSRKDICSLYMLVFRSFVGWLVGWFVFSFVNKLRAGRMNAITNKSRILCLVFSCCMFLFIAFCLYVSLHNSTLIYMISNGCSIEQCLHLLHTSPCCSPSFSSEPALTCSPLSLSLSSNFGSLLNGSVCIHNI